MAGASTKRVLIHKSSSIEIISGAKGKKEQLTIDGNSVPFLKHANGLYYTGLLPYAQYKDPESLAKALIESHPSYMKPAKTKSQR